MTHKNIGIGLTLLLFTSLVFAGVTGKIAGRVTDTATGDPLMGVNVQLIGTYMGAATNTDGNYFILNISPGTYELKATMIGYSTYTVQKIRVEIDLTTFVDIQMETTVIQGETVVVQAQQKLVKLDVAASQRSVSFEQIVELPISSVSEVIELQAGISGFQIRGGSEDQTMYVVDDIVLNDERTGNPTTGIPISAIQDISIQTGGFNAEYHNVRSGVVNLVTKEGYTDRYTGTIQIRYSPPTQKHFGISPYDPQSYWFKPYSNPEVMWTGTGNQVWDEYTLRQYPRFDGWIRIAEQSMEDDDPSNDLSPTAAYRLFTWEHRKEGAIDLPDYNIDGGFGGPVPFISSSLGNLRFYASFRQDQDVYLFRLSRPGLTTNTTMIKLTSDVSPTMKLTFTGRYGEIYATTQSRGGLTGYFDSSSELADEVDRAGFTMPWRLYTNNYWSPTTIRNSSFSAKLTHQLSQKTFYRIMAKFDRKDYRTHPGADRDTTKEYQVFPDWLADEAPLGFSGTTEYSNEGRLSFGGAISTSRDTSTVRTFSLKADVTSQVNHQHEVQTGMELIYNDLNLIYGSQNFFLPLGNYSSKIRQFPYRFYAYFQDKLEIKGFFAIIGINMDYVNPNGDWYVIKDGSEFFRDLDWDFYSSSYSEEVEANFTMKKVKPQVTFSPRLAISHPITEVSKLYFNYGHYRQMPRAEDLYRARRHADGNLYNLGDPTLPLARTISYELGYDHALFESYLFHVTAYYKDVTDQQDNTDYISTNGSVNYSQLTANSYEDIRGFELDLSKMRGRWLTGHINYEYRVNTSGYFGIREYYDSPKEQRDYILKNPQQSKPIPRPRMKSVLDFHSPYNFKPRVLADWHLNLISRWTAGRWFTYNPKNVTGITYNVQWKDYYSFDIKLSKTFSSGKTRIKFFMDIYNVFNLKNFSTYGFIDAFDWDDYMKSLHLPSRITDKLEYIGIPGDDQPGSYRASGTKFVPIEWISSIDEEEDNPRYINRQLESDREIYYFDNSTGEYMEYEDGQWRIANSKRIDEILDNRAYIDMPNQASFVFLAPRDIYFGLNISYEF